MNYNRNGGAEYLPIYLYTDTCIYQCVCVCVCARARFVCVYI